MFKCPECGNTTLNEHEVGPTITREVKRVDADDFCTVYNTYWVSEESKMWWTCRKCGWRLPAKYIVELVAYLNRSIK